MLLMIIKNYCLNSWFHNVHYSVFNRGADFENINTTDIVRHRAPKEKIVVKKLEV